MNEIFDSYVQNAFCEEKQAKFKFQQFAGNYRQFFPAHKKAVLLDIGIGRGEMLSCMQDWGYENAFGIDISPSTVAFCASLDLKCERVEDTVSWLKKHQESYDLITLLDVLEHVPKRDTITFLKALHGSLKANGVLLIQVPNMQAPDSQLHHYYDFTHEAGFGEKNLRQVLFTAGFTDIEMYGFEDSVSPKIREKIRLLLRTLLWQIVRLMRRINGNLNPEILHPVFFAVVRKGK